MIFIKSLFIAYLSVNLTLVNACGIFNWDIMGVCQTDAVDQPPFIREAVNTVMSRLPREKKGYNTDKVFSTFTSIAWDMTQYNRTFSEENVN